MTILEITTKKVKNDSIEKDDIQMAIDEVQQAILTYCNIDDIPEALNFVWANMSSELARYQYELGKAANANIDGIDIADVESIKIGDTQVSLGSSAGSNNLRAQTLKSHRPNLDQIVLNYKDQLNRFRRMVW